MVARYFEPRRRIHLETANIIADIMRHLHARQHLGKAIVVCEEPTAALGLAQRQWLKLARTLQRRRAATFNADTILKYTYTITHMQHMNFVAAVPLEQPEAQGYFMRPDQLRNLPPNCLSIYLAERLSETALPELVSALPPSSLITDYFDQIQAGDFGLRPRAELEASLSGRWRAVEAFLADHEIDLAALDPRRPDSLTAMDEALDTSLSTGLTFLHLARSFQHTLDLARPLRTITKRERERYDLFVLLAHRVQSLTPGAAPAQFLKTYADDSFFLQDRRAGESLADLITRHRLAGRWHLAEALVSLAQAGQVPALGGQPASVTDPEFPLVLQG